MAKQRINVIAKSNATYVNKGKGTICRADVLRLIYERKDRFSDRVRSCDIDDILEALKLKHSEAQTVENMIRGHRRKGFIDPPKPIVDLTETETPQKPSESTEEQQRSPSPITIECDLNVTPPSPLAEVRNKRLFDASGYHDPKSALQPAKLRFRKMKSTPTEELMEISSNEIKFFSISPPSPTLTAPLSTVEDATPLTEPLQSEQKQPTPISQNQRVLDSQSEQPSSPPQNNEALKRGRRIKITPRRDTIVKPSEKAIECPKISLHTPAIIQPSFPYTCNQQNMILSQYQPNLGQSFIVPQNLYQTSAIAQLLIHQQMFSAQQYALQQYFTPMLIQQPQNSLRNFFESYTP